MLGDVLEALGHQVVVLLDGAAAIERLGREPFDVVFTDLAMPGVSGWQVVRAARDTAPATPAYLVTGFGAELSAAERATRGVAGIFAKPLKIEEIMDAVAQVARGRGGPRNPED